jgi:hypothetical protein
VTVPHRHAWLWEPLEEEPTFILRAMFGSKALYLHGRMVAAFFTKAEPWRGMMVCTERGYHESLRAEFPQLTPHPVLPKWLYLPEANDDFDRVAEKLMRLVQIRDPRIGIVPPPKKKRLRKESGA